MKPVIKEINEALGENIKKLTATLTQEWCSEVNTVVKKNEQLTTHTLEISKETSEASIIKITEIEDNIVTIVN